MASKDIGPSFSIRLGKPSRGVGENAAWTLPTNMRWDFEYHWGLDISLQNILGQGV